MLFEIWLPLTGGFILLIFGGELLVRGAVRIATRLGVSPLVIGLTLVGFGTSTPELVTTVQAALSGSPGIAFGNIVGSNVANILLILGASALICPILVTSAALKRDGAVMVVTALVFALVASTVPVGRIVGSVFVVALAAYIVIAFRQERTADAAGHGAVYEKGLAAQEVDSALAPSPQPGAPVWMSLLVAFGGLAAVVGGGYFLVGGATALARSIGISETVIGLTIVAVGTSMPELVTSIVAAARKQTDVAFGNIIGSNIYNILGIGGAAGLIAPTRVPQEILGFDNVVMIAASVLVVALAWTGRLLNRWEGGLMLMGYAAYVWWLWP